MKKYLSLLLVLLLLTGCGGPAASTAPAAAPTAAPTAPPTTVPETTAAPTEPPIPPELAADADVIVHTVDEFLAALGPGKTILLAPGVYDLTSASDYGRDSGSPFYSWYDGGYIDGWQLELRRLQDTVIRGCGQNSTFLMTYSALANVLSLNGCTGMTLEGFTAGHAENTDGCSGSVLYLEGMENSQLRNLGLYGCGTVGVDMDSCYSIAISSCDIYDCSVSGIAGLFCGQIMVENCNLYDLGTAFSTPANTTVSFNDCDDITFAGTTVRGNRSNMLMDFYDCRHVFLTECSFTDNYVLDAAFNFSGDIAVLDNCSFDNNDVFQWYGPYSNQAKSLQGQWLTPDFFPVYAPSQDPLPPQKQVHVKNAEEFLSAIAPDTEIILDAPVYDLTEAFFDANPTCPVYYWEYDSMDHALIIRDVDNFSITGSEDHTAHSILTTSIYADVLTFENCSNITLSGFTAGHDEVPGTCTGDVLYFNNVNGLRVENCGLFGCGVIGIDAIYCRDVVIEDCDIYECSSHGITFTSVRDAELNGNTFRDLGISPTEFYDCHNILVDGVPDYRAR